MLAKGTIGKSGELQGALFLLFRPPHSLWHSIGMHGAVAAMGGTRAEEGSAESERKKKNQMRPSSSSSPPSSFLLFRRRSTGRPSCFFSSRSPCPLFALARPSALHYIRSESRDVIAASPRSREPGFAAASPARVSARGRRRDWRKFFLLLSLSLTSLCLFPFLRAPCCPPFGGSLAVVARKHHFASLLFFLSLFLHAHSFFLSPAL